MTIDYLDSAVVWGETPDNYLTSMQTCPTPKPTPNN
jgi:hypothetical protein